MKADCVIVGAGPAGSMTALLLARGGFEVVVMDRQLFPRAKPCGDCLSPQANLLLDELGLLPSVVGLEPARLSGWRIVAPSGSWFDARFADASSDSRTTYGFAVSRARFDDVLLQSARAAGARVYTGVRFEHLLWAGNQVVGVSARGTDGELLEVQAGLTVGADGLRSAVRQRLGLAARPPRLHKVALCAHVTGLAQVSGLGELHLADGACVGVAPIHGNASDCNITLVLDAKRFGRALAGKPVAEFRNRLAQFPGLRDRLEHLSLRSELLAAGPFDRPAAAVVAPGAALVGDAAGYFDPFTGQGIYQALAGAQLLNRVAQRALRERTSHRPLFGYARAQQRLVRGTQRVQRIIEWACARLGRAERCITGLSCSPRAAAHLLAVTGDLRPPVSLLSPYTVLSFIAGLASGSHAR